MYVIFKTNHGSIKVSGSILITSVLVALLSLIVIIRAADYNSTSDTGYASIVMNATVSNYVGVNLSAALQRGILFGSLTANTNNNMAENNTNGTGAGEGNVTEYWIGNDPASTGSISLWHNASDMDRSGASDTILIANVTHESNTTEPDVGSNVNMSNIADGTVLMTNTYSSIGSENCSSVTTSGACWIAYWLDVPSSISGGTYNTTYNYCGNLTISTVACG